VKSEKSFVYTPLKFQRFSARGLLIKCFAFLKMINQKTLVKSIETSGIGLHYGRRGEFAA
jgi:hypothetical protein